MAAWTPAPSYSEGSPKSGAAQSTRTHASPTAGSIVVNGYAPSGTSFIVAVVGLSRSPTARQRKALTTALNNVDFPTEGLPTRPNS